jgi:hypothetical protein
MNFFIESLLNVDGLTRCLAALLGRGGLRIEASCHD